jgi:hypothetical protein
VALLEVENSLVFDWNDVEFNTFYSMISQAKGCLWVTRGGQIKSEVPFSSPINALLQTIRSEDPQKSVYALDLDPISSIDSESAERAVISVLCSSFDARAASDETEYSERGGRLLIPRVILQDELSSRIERGDAQRSPEIRPFFQENRPLRLEVGALGDLNSLYFDDDPESLLPLEDEDVEIRVRAVGIDSVDVKNALGETSNTTIRSDVAGLITRIGSLVSKVAVGDRVATMVPGAFKNFVRVHESLIQSIPDGVDLETTASLLSSHAAAYYSVITVGRLQKGEAILIHAGASDFGQAAIQIAKNIGVEIYTTIGSLEERKTLVDLYEIGDDCIFDYHSSYFDKDFLRLRGKKGVDLILTSLGENTLQQHWNCISECECFPNR